MTLTKGNIALSVVCVLAGILLGAGFRSCSQPKQPQVEPIIIHDTLCITDTIRIAARTKTVTIEKWDTLIVRDTDSIVVTMPLEHKQYRDTFTTDSSRIELGVRFSGWHAQINGIDLKSQYTIQPRTIEKRKGWGQFIGVGIGVGYGASVVGQTVYVAPEIGLHITYGLGYHW